MAGSLRRLSALQTEFGVFTSLKTLERPRGRACWNMMRAGLVPLEEHLHGDGGDRKQVRLRWVPAWGLRAGVCGAGGPMADALCLSVSGLVLRMFSFLP